MAARVVLAALIGLGLAIVGVATVHVAGAESAASASSALSAECSGSAVDASRCEGAERRGHLAWNAASWLIGLALVVAIGRRSGTAADGSAN
jgi:hypothetical protein